MHAVMLLIDHLHVIDEDEEKERKKELRKRKCVSEWAASYVACRDYDPDNEY